MQCTFKKETDTNVSLDLSEISQRSQLYSPQSSLKGTFILQSITSKFRTCAAAHHVPLIISTATQCTLLPATTTRIMFFCFFMSNTLFCIFRRMVNSAVFCGAEKQCQGAGFSGNGSMLSSGFLERQQSASRLGSSESVGESA